MTTRLDQIATRQPSRIRTAIFAMCLAVVGYASLSTVQTAAAAAHHAPVALSR